MSSQRGFGLIIMMMTVLLMLGLVGAVMPLVTTETAMAANYRRAMQLLYAAEAALEVVISELGRVRVWDDVLRRAPTPQASGRRQRASC